MLEFLFFAASAWFLVSIAVHIFIASIKHEQLAMEFAAAKEDIGPFFAALSLIVATLISIVFWPHVFMKSRP